MLWRAVFCTWKESRQRMGSREGRGMGLFLTSCCVMERLGVLLHLLSINIAELFLSLIQYPLLCINNKDPSSVLIFFRCNSAYRRFIFSFFLFFFFFMCTLFHNTENTVERRFHKSDLKGDCQGWCSNQIYVWVIWQICWVAIASLGVCREERGYRTLFLW